MGRAPCCAKVGLKKGAWSAEEDEKLVAFVNNHGHPNWRALPKQAGLLRCGKSCRLRWMNYLRPDIRRGNFTPEEEDLIITLHHSLGNRWSAIAAQLPGRTDNEIKNIWHTNLKKKRTAGAKDGDEHQHRKPPEPNGTDDGRPCAASPSRCSSAGTCSSAVTESTADDGAAKEESSGGLPPPLDESFWSSDVMGMEEELSLRSGTSRSEDMDFWFRLLYEAGGMEDLDAL